MDEFVDADQPLVELGQILVLQRLEVDLGHRRAEKSPAENCWRMRTGALDVPKGHSPP